MDLRLSPEDETFRGDVRAWAEAHLPASIRVKVEGHQRLDPEETRCWARILGRQQALDSCDSNRIDLRKIFKF